MKNFASIFVLFIMMIACSKSDEIVSPTSATLEWRAYSLTTTPAFEITSFTATSGGTLVNNGGGNSTTEKGICYNTSPNPTTSNYKIIAYSEAGTFVCVMKGLTGNTKYYIRAYVVKNGVTNYGNQVNFTTYPNPGTITDVDGNVYATINIGGQIWMMENLKTTKYRDGTPVPVITDNTEWFGTSEGAYCNYNNNASNVATYGRLYNWFALNDSHNLAPVGWHIPTKSELDILEGYLGELSTRGGKLKEAGFAHWIAPNEAADNSSGFKGLPGGQRQSQGSFLSLGLAGHFWSSSTDAGWPYWISLFSDSGQLGRTTNIITPDYQKHNGFSVRCVRD